MGKTNKEKVPCAHCGDPVPAKLLWRRDRFGTGKKWPPTCSRDCFNAYKRSSPHSRAYKKSLLWLAKAPGYLATLENRLEEMRELMTKHIDEVQRHIEGRERMLTDAFVFRVLDLSTSHMTLDDNQVLELNRDSTGVMPAYELGEYGWFCYVGEIDENWKEDMSEAFLVIMQKAKEMGCEYVRFDRDGRTYDELPVFDW